MLRNFEEALAQIKKDNQESQQEITRQDEANSTDSETQRGNRSRTNNNNALRVQRLNEQYQRMIDRFRADFEADSEIRQTLEGARQAAVSQMTGELLGEDADEIFKQKIYDPLSQLELQLLERLDAIELGKKLHVSNKADVPAEYKRMVEKYFESISKAK
jgi:hypothetical protein